MHAAPYTATATVTVPLFARLLITLATKVTAHRNGGAEAEYNGFMGGQANKRMPGRVKRQHVEADDGWTVVTHGLSKVSLASRADKSPSEVKSDGRLLAPLLPAEVVEGLTAQKLLCDFRKLQEQWTNTALARQIEDVLDKRAYKVADAVCIGLGSCSRDWEHRWRSLWQLALFVGVVQRLKQFSPQEQPKMWAQDPAHTSLDMEFLGLLDIQVMQSGIETRISASSFVYSPFVDWFLLLPTFLSGQSAPKVAADPVLYIGNEILDDYTLYARTEEKKEKLAECNELGKQFLERRTAVKLREFELHAHALNGMVVYYSVEKGQ